MKTKPFHLGRNKKPVAMWRSSRKAKQLNRSKKHKQKSNRSRSYKLHLTLVKGNLARNPSLPLWCDPGYSSIAGCLLLPGVPRDASRIAWGIPLPSPSRPFPFLLFLPPLPSPHPLSPSPHPQDPQECVCSFPVLSCFSCLAAVFLLRCLFCFALFALCAFSPCPLPLFLSFVLPASCVLPGLFFAFVVFLCFPVVVVVGGGGGGGGWLSLCVCVSRAQEHPKPFDMEFEQESVLFWLGFWPWDLQQAQLQDFLGLVTSVDANLLSFKFDSQKY